jgi:iron(III) transport system ATP-binding protein
LRLIAGLEMASEGQILIGGRDVTRLSAADRDVSMVFQSYALFPHMTVLENVAYGPSVSGVPKRQARDLAHDKLALVGLKGFDARLPSELSGGQQQRVALARTLVYRPEMLLLDEPLSNLDAKLRDRARIWLGELPRKTGMTTVYVTHDQAEALSMSDKIIVMDSGTIAQVGTPKEVYEHPRTAFVADFVGAANLVEARVELAGGERQIRLNGGPLLRVDQGTVPSAGPVTLGIRPERIRIATTSDEANAVPARVVANSYLGARNILVAEVGSQQFRVETEAVERGAHVNLVLPSEALFLYPARRAHSGGRDATG